MEVGSGWRLFLAAVVLAAACGAQQDPGEDYKISLDVDLVLLEVAVSGPGGVFVSGLERDQFRVYENGRRQATRHFQQQDVPATIGLVVDTSGSMRSRHPQVTSALVALSEASHPNDQTFVVNFNDRVSFGLPAGVDFTNDRTQLKQALTSTLPDGRTALHDALLLALEHLRKGKHTRKALVVVSDGGDNASRRRFHEVLRAAQSSSTLIYTIGLLDEENRDRKPRILKALARETGAEAFLSVKTPDVFEICRRIAMDMRSRYSIGYVPAATVKPEAYRAIRVEVTGGKDWKVRTRRGYSAPAVPTSSSEEDE